MGRTLAPTGGKNGGQVTTTLVAGLRRTGMVAPMVLDGPINRDAFAAYVRQVLVPELALATCHHRQPVEPKGSGRARNRRGRRCRAALTSALQPDFNPIEQAIFKLKAHLRKAAERTIHGLWDAIGRILDLYPPQECQLLRNRGYDAN